MVQNTPLFPSASPNFDNDLMLSANLFSIAADPEILAAASILVGISTSSEPFKFSGQKCVKISTAQQFSVENFPWIEQEFTSKLCNAKSTHLEDMETRFSKLSELAQFTTSYPKELDPSQPDPTGKCYILAIPLELLQQISGYLQDDYVSLVCFSLSGRRFYEEVTRLRNMKYPTKRKFRISMGITQGNPFGKYKLEISTLLGEWMGADLIFDSFYTKRFVKLSTDDLYKRVEGILEIYQRRVKFDNLYQCRAACLRDVAAHELKKRIIKPLRLSKDLANKVVVYWPVGFPKELEEALGKVPLKGTRAAHKIQEAQSDKSSGNTESSGGAQKFTIPPQVSYSLVPIQW